MEWKVVYREDKLKPKFTYTGEGVQGEIMRG